MQLSRKAAVGVGAVVAATLFLALRRRRRARAEKAEAVANSVANAARVSPFAVSGERFPVIQTGAFPEGWALGPLVAPSPGILCRSLMFAPTEGDATRIDAAFLAVVPEAVPDDAAATPGGESSEADVLASRLLRLCPFVAAEGAGSAVATKLDHQAGSPFTVRLVRGDVTAVGGFVKHEPSGLQLAVTVVFVGSPRDDEIHAICGALRVDQSVAPFPAGSIATVSAGEGERHVSSYVIKPGGTVTFSGTEDGSTRAMFINAEMVDVSSSKVVYVNDDVGFRFGIVDGSIQVAPFGACFTLDHAPLPSTNPDTALTVMVSSVPRGWEAAVSPAGKPTIGGGEMMLSAMESDRSRLHHNITMHLLGPSHTILEWREVDVGGILFTSVDTHQADFRVRTLACETKKKQLVVLRCIAPAAEWDAVAPAYRDIIDTMHFTNKIAA